jgi:hypothetical protein
VGDNGYPQQMIISQISPQADKEALNVRYLHHQTDYERRRQYTGKMSRRQPELVNGFVPLATETGQWLYFAPADVKRWSSRQFLPRKKPMAMCRLSVEIKSRWWVPVYLRTLTVFCLMMRCEPDYQKVKLPRQAWH